MADIIVNQSDWNVVRGLDAKQLKTIEMDNPYNFGIHKYNEDVWTSGYIGVNRIRDVWGNYLKDDNNNTYVFLIQPRFAVNPFQMLDAVLKDKEYSSYEASDAHKGEFLFKFFEKEPLIEMTGDCAGGELLLAIAFVKACEEICKKKIKNQMSFHTENLSGKVKGKIVFNKHIIKNVCESREDRVYCKYPSFSIDTAENRILKAGLKKSMIIINRIGIDLKSIKASIRYCNNLLENVREISLSSSIFGLAKTNGMYAYYKKAISLAKVLYKNGSISVKDGIDEKKYLIMPYEINMEKLFEYYARAIIREKLEEPYGLEAYDTHINTYKGDAKNCHLSRYVIPDIMIYKKEKELINGQECECKKYVSVYDVKYKDHERANRHDTHQLLSYSLLLDVYKTGFILPNNKTDDDGDKINSVTDDSTVNSQVVIPLEINTKRNLTHSLKYYEYLVGDTKKNRT